MKFITTAPRENCVILFPKRFFNLFYGFVVIRLLVVGGNGDWKLFLIVSRSMGKLCDKLVKEIRQIAMLLYYFPLKHYLSSNY